MANEILVLDGDGTETYTLLFLYPLSAPKQYDNPARNIIVTPSNQLPAYGAELLTASEISALDAGTLAFELVGFTKNASLTNAQLVSIIQQIYSDKKAAFLISYNNRYLHLGVRISAV